LSGDGRRRMKSLFAAVLIAAATSPATSAHAGPCTADLDALQPKVSALVDATAGQGKTATESTAATESRQPTPQSIADAEAKLGEGGTAQAAVDAMSEARRADAAGDADGCAADVARVRAALKL
jgi:hypothetical protein